jgi:transposase InsO family protein
MARRPAEPWSLLQHVAKSSRPDLQGNPKTQSATAKQERPAKHERVNTIQVVQKSPQDQVERVNTTSEGERQRAASADATKQPLAATGDAEDGEEDMKPEVGQQRAVEKVCGDPLRTLGFRPDHQQGKIYGLMQELETRMGREDTAVKRDVMKELERKVGFYTAKVKVIDKGLKEIRKKLEKEDATEGTTPALQTAEVQVLDGALDEQEELGELRADERTPRQEAWMDGVETSLRNLYTGLERSLEMISGTLDYHHRMVIELYGAMNMDPPTGNTPQGSYRDDGASGGDDLPNNSVGDHNAFRGGDRGNKPRGSTPSNEEREGGASRHTNPDDDRQVEDATTTNRVMVEEQPTTGEELQQQQEPGLGEDNGNTPARVEETAGEDLGAENTQEDGNTMVYTRAGIFAMRDHDATLDVRQPGVTNQPVPVPVPPVMLFKPPTERVNTISSVWRETFEGKSHEDIECFMMSFEIHCKLTEVKDDELCNMLWLHLKGYAQKVIKGMPNGTKADYMSMKKRLQDMFGKGDQRDSAKAKLEDLRYTRGTRIIEFIGEVIMLLQEAYPNDGMEVRDARAYDLIMSKLPQEMLTQLALLKVDTLDKIKSEAATMEKLTRIAGKEMGRRQAQPVNATFMDTEATNVGIVGSRLDAPPAPRPSRFDRATPPRYKPNRTPVRAQTQPRMDYPGDRQVFGGQRPTRFQTRNVAPRANVTCGHCGRNGHAAMFCWRNPQSQYYKPGFGEPRVTGQEYAPPGFARRGQPAMRFQQPQGSQVGYYPQPQIEYSPEPQTQMVQQVQCQTCGGVGHIARQCPSGYAIRESTSAPNLRHGGGQPFGGGGLQQLAQEMSMMRLGNPQGQGANPVMQVMHQGTQQGTQVQTQTPSVGLPDNRVTTISMAQKPQEEETQEPNKGEEPKRSYTYEEGKALEDKLKMLTSKFFRRDDREEPATDIVATLTRHEDGKTPEYRPPDFRMVIIPVKVNDIRIAGLLDTGSSITLASRGLADELGIKTEASDKTIRSMTCHTEAASEKASVVLDIAGHRREVTIHFTADTLWMDNPYDMIIGGDTMQEFPEYKVNTAERRFTMGSKPISWKTKAEVMLEERKVFLIHDITIPPRHEVLVDALIDRSKGKVNAIVSIEQTGEGPIQLNDTLSDVDKDYRCKVLLSNPTEAPITARRHTVVGKARNVIEDDKGYHEYPEITATMAEEFRNRDVTDPTYIVDYESCDCTREQKEQLKALLEKYRDQFSKNGYDLGMAKVNPMQIRTTTEQPYRPTIYQPDRGMRDKVAEELEKMQEMGCIRESNTPWLSPLVMVKKKTGDMRPCIDLRKLNAITIPDYYPLPRVHDALDRIGGSYYFTCLDLSKGFWQLPLDDDASWKCGIISNDRVYQCLTMPFGLRNAPSAFMRAMRTILGPVWDKCVVYIDDIVITTKVDSFEQHLRDIEDVLERFKLFNMKVNPKKCEFVRKEISFLGHRVTKDGYRPDERNTVKIQELPTPTTQAEVRHCLGVFSFFRRLIEGFANIAAPLTALCGKGAKFAWSDDSQKAFDTLKEKLVTGPMVEFPDDNLEFHIHVDASTKAIGIALTQRKEGDTVGRPICFYSRALSKAEQKKPAVQLELMAIVEALRWCRYYTYGKKVVVHTDHRPLIHLMQKRTTHVNLTRWLIELQQYDNVVIEYLDGKKNTLADALSRWEALTEGRPVVELEDMVHGPFGLNTDGDNHELTVPREEVCHVMHVMNSTKSMQELQAEDTILSQAIQAIRDKTDPATIKDTELRWYVEKCELNSNDTLVLKSQREGEEGHAMIVPRAWRRAVFDQFHGSEIGGGHTNARSTQGKMKDFAWRGMPRDVAEWHKRCYQCQVRAPKRRKVPPVMTRLQRPFETMGLDCCGPLQVTEDGSKHYLLCIDELSKYAITIAIPDVTCLTIVKALWDHVILKYGCPQVIVTDNAKTFTAEFFKEFLHRLGIEGRYSTPYHSDGNAITERAFRTYHDMIAKYTTGMHPKDGAIPWDQKLPIATFAYNVTRHSTTGETPFMMMHGRDPIFPIELALHEKRAVNEPLTVKEFRKRLVKLVETTYEHALESFDEAVKRIKAQADKHCIESDIVEGELVLYRDYDLRVGMSSKFKNLWKDVYRVRKLQDQHAWIVPTTSPNDQLKRVHLNQIKRFYPEQAETENPTAEQGSPAGGSESPTRTQTRRGRREEKKQKRIQEQQAQMPETTQKKRGEGTKYNLRQTIRSRKEYGQD